MEEEKNSLAYEILKENKVLTKRLFIICIIEFFIIVGMVVGFFIYESQYEYATTTEETYTQESNESSNISQTIN
jgi:capsular polysaccharide biosynthesis protein